MTHCNYICLLIDPNLNNSLDLSIKDVRRKKKTNVTHTT